MLYTALAHAYPSLIERMGLGRPVKLANMVVSNPFGMPKPCYLMGAEVELVLPISLVAPGQTLNITSVTLGQKFQIGFLALPEAVPQVEKLAAYAVDAFAELQQAMPATCEIVVRRFQDARHEPAIAVIDGDQRVVGEQCRKRSRRISRLDARTMETAHPDDAIVFQCDVDERLVDVRVALVLPLEIAQVERAVGAPEALLQLRDRALVLGAALRDAASIHRRIPPRIPSR